MNTTTPVRLSPDAAARLDALFRQYRDFVLRLAVAQLHDADGAEDLAQTVWLSIIPTLVRGETIAHPHAFLATVVRRRAINHRVSAPVRRERAEDWSDATAARALPAAPPAEDDALAAGELTTYQATVLKLSAQGTSQRAIARRLGRSQQAVQQTLHRAARNLRHSLTTAA